MLAGVLPSTTAEDDIKPDLKSVRISQESLSFFDKVEPSKLIQGIKFSFLAGTSPGVWISPVRQRVDKSFSQSSICNIVVLINHHQGSANQNLTMGGRPQDKDVPC